MEFPGFILVSVYISPNKKFDGLLEDLQYVTQNDNNVLLAGDFNVHLPGITTLKSYVKKDHLVADWIAANDLVVMNKRNVATWQSYNDTKKSTVDYTLTKNTVVENWVVRQDMHSMSDHFYIFFDVLGMAPLLMD